MQLCCGKVLNMTKADWQAFLYKKLLKSIEWYFQCWGREAGVSVCVFVCPSSAMLGAKQVCFYSLLRFLIYCKVHSRKRFKAR